VKQDMQWYRRSHVVFDKLDVLFVIGIDFDGLNRLAYF
jgi:hypothetical protein